MKPSIRNTTEGKAREVTSKVKEKIGRATDNPKLEAAGQDEKISGKIQKTIHQVERVLED
jgi:uncharacterized protein YjbJ (UPF0337 family)